ncbi:MAG: sugar phosphate nucleotidyltransferase [Verrucomicrobiota bacterium]
MSDKFVVIMAGGKGERFWPQSRLARPKQLLPIVGDKAMITQTVERLPKDIPAENVFVITNIEQRDAVLEVCPQLLPERVIGEPIGRDTAAAVALATLLVKRESPDATFAMLPADAAIHDAENFAKVIDACFAAAATSSVIATVGISPTHPATGYGYIHRGSTQEADKGMPVYSVKRFVEKPDFETAEAYLASGEYLWNAGMFLWSVSTIEGLIREFTPDLYEQVQGIEADLDSGMGLAASMGEHYPKLEKISVDYAILEKAPHVVCLAATFDWDDVGEWTALERHFPQDDSGNTLRGDVFVENAGNNIVCADEGHTISLLGVDDLIVVQTPDATLICKKDQTQNIKTLVKRIGESRPDLM